jgi:hypothetical protein
MRNNLKGGKTNFSSPFQRFEPIASLVHWFRPEARKNSMTAGTCGRGYCSPQGSQEAERQTGGGQRHLFLSMSPQPHLISHLLWSGLTFQSFHHLLRIIQFWIHQWSNPLIKSSSNLFSKSPFLNIAWEPNFKHMVLWGTFNTQTTRALYCD